jgi:ABC-type Fe3+/spermidine/putrescine transport system ATPase subunit
MPLEITGLSRRFGNKWVLRDAEFTAREGRVLGLLGASASGKSTLLRLIAGQIRTNGGKLLFDGEDITRIKARDRGVTFLSGSDGRGPKGLFRVFGGADTVSGSERQLSMFEETIGDAGPIVLLDEPFSQMDARAREKSCAAVKRAARGRDRIVIFASSDFQQIAAVADDVAVLSGGAIVQTGTPNEIYDEPQTIETARLTGEGNFFAARRLTSSDEDLPEFFTIDGGHRLFAQQTEKSRLGAINKTVTLAIRPEQVSMSAGASFPEDNLLRAVVTAIKFRGATSLIEFDAVGLRLETRVFKIVGLSVGDECMLGLPPHRILILKD